MEKDQENQQTGIAILVVAHLMGFAHITCQVQISYCIKSYRIVNTDVIVLGLDSSLVVLSLQMR